MQSFNIRSCPSLAAGIVLAALACSAQAAPPVSEGHAASVKPGLWEASTTVENAAATSSRSVIARTCISSVDALNIASIVPIQRELGMQCENRDVKLDGSAIVWEVVCRSASASQTGKGRMSLFVDSYAGSAELELRKPGAKPSKFRQSFTGKWLQACA